MTQTILAQLTTDRDTARLQSPKETYPILTRILGDYELGAKAKKPRTGDDALVLIIKGILAGNAETVVLLQKSQGGEKEHAAEILRLENQSRLLQKYIPAKVEPEVRESAVDEEILLKIINENGFDKLGLFHKYLKDTFGSDGYDGKLASSVFNAAQKAKDA